MRYGLGRKELKTGEKDFSVAALEFVSSLFPVSGPDMWNKCQKYITNVQRAFEWAILCGRELTVANLLARLLDYLYECGRWRER